MPINVPGSLRFWRAMTVAGPVAAGVLPLLVVGLPGGFEDMTLVGQPVTMFQAFGILGAMCFPVAAYFFCRMKLEVEQSRLSRSWPTVTGQLHERDAVERSYGYLSKRYIFTVRYGYQVGGERFTSDRLAFSSRLLMGNNGAGPSVGQLEQKYKAGQPVTVHYDPADPTNAVLETGEELARQRLSPVLWTIGLTLVIVLLTGMVNGR